MTDGRTAKMVAIFTQAFLPCGSATYPMKDEVFSPSKGDFTKFIWNFKHIFGINKENDD
jgi:phosphotransferase system IIA component